MFNHYIFSCVTPSSTFSDNNLNLTTHSSEDDYDITFESNTNTYTITTPAGDHANKDKDKNKIKNKNKDSTDKTVITNATVDKYDQHQQQSMSPMSEHQTSDCILLSQQELSAVVVMGFDEYGQLKNASRSESDAISIQNSITQQIETPLGVTQKTNNNHFFDDDTVSTNDSCCKIVERLKRDKKHYGGNCNDSISSNSIRSQQQEDSEHRRPSSRRQRSDSSISVSSSLSGSSNHKRRIREVFKQQQAQHRQTQILSIQEFAGFSTRSSSKKTASKKKATGNSTSTKKNGSTSSNKPSWFRKMLHDSSFGAPKRHNKVADWSVVISSVTPTIGSRSVNDSLCSDGLDRNTHLVSILRKNNQNCIGPATTTAAAAAAEPSCCPSESTVRFAEGTVFQDPYQVRRKKVPRINGRTRGRSSLLSQKKRRYQRQQQHNKKENRLSVATPSSPSLGATTSALTIDDKTSCSPIDEMGPLVNSMVSATVSSMGCYVFR